MSRPIEPGNTRHEPRGPHLPTLARAFAEAWGRATGLADAPDLSLFLPDPDAPQRRDVLHRLIAIDLGFRWQYHQPVCLEEYLQRYGELGGAEVLPSELLFEEYRARHLYGDRPSQTAYAKRFPLQFPEMVRLIEEHSAQTVQSVAQPPPASNRLSHPIRGRVLDITAGYRLLERIGRGNFGDVWRAEAPGGVEVAIKVIHRPIDHEEVKRELQSLELIKRVRHPYLLATQAYWQLEDQLLIAIELADCSLADRLRQCPQGVPVPELLGYFAEAAEAVDFLHAQHVLHRDIKPGNILLLQGHVKVADFGLARLQEAGRAVTATFCGTPHYMAPEVWDQKISPHSDQYSLAVTYAELRLGRPPFKGKTVWEVQLSHLTGAADLAPLPEEEQRVLFKALSKDPEERFGSCEEFVRALAKVHHPAPPPEDTTREHSPKTTLIAPVDGPDADPLSAVVSVRQSATPHWREKAPPLGAGLPRPANRAGKPRPYRRVVMLAMFCATLGVTGWLLASAGYLPFPGDTTEPEVPPVVLPANCRKAGDEIATDLYGKRYYKRIVLDVEGMPVEFVLVPKKKGEDPETFYIMRDKVSVDQFRRFAEARPEVQWKPSGLGDNYPALGVRGLDAIEFAKWLGGFLPTAMEWDKAAGRYEDPRQEGPYKGQWKGAGSLKIAVGYLRGPWELGEAKDDESLFGCRDMSGNGYEWTGTLQNGEEFKEGGASDFVKWRAVSYAAPAPFRFEAGLEPGRSLRDKPSDDVGFRVVLRP